MLRPLLTIALLAAPVAAPAAAPPLLAKPAAEPDPDARRLIADMQVHVVQIRVSRVQPPTTEPGDCVVTGVIEVVWRSDLFQPGAELTVTAPCGSSVPLDRGRGPLAPAAIDPRVVMQATRACVHLRRSGELAWTDGGRRPGPCSFTSGYTPLDPPRLLLDPSSRL